MAKKKRISGWFTFPYHDAPIGWLDDFEERVRIIKATKPEHEIPIRLKWMRPVDVAKLPEEVVKARAARAKAYAAWAKARAAWVKARAAVVKADAAWAKACAARVKAYAAWAKTCAAGVKAYAAGVKVDAAWDAYKRVLRKYRFELESIALEQCPDAPWNGKELVFEDNNGKGNAKN